MKLSPEYARNVRSDLADQIENSWVGQETSVVGLQYLQLVDGRVEKGPYALERADIFCFQDMGRCNVFVDADGTWHANVWTDAKELTKAENTAIGKFVAEQMEAQKAYVAHEAKFLRERPWEDVYGMTPEDAVKSLREWEVNAREEGEAVAYVNVTAPDGELLARFEVYANELENRHARAHIGDRVVDAAK